MFKSALQNSIEALIFVSETGIQLAEIEEIFKNEDIRSELGIPLETSITSTLLLEVIEDIKLKYQTEESFFELFNFKNSFQFLTKNKYHGVINQLQNQRSKKKLSQAAMETLAIITYRQPITKLEVEHIRGVNCDYSIQRLLEKELIKIVGKAETVGKPILYAPSENLLDYFGIQDFSQLPSLKDIENQENTIGDKEA